MIFFCDADPGLPVPVQQGTVALLGPNAASFHSKTSHSPFLSEAQEVVDGLEYAMRMVRRRLRLEIESVTGLWRPGSVKDDGLDSFSDLRS